MSKRTVHLICNAHLDPVWLWEWEEGAAEAISTFRVAADFCEESEGFVFNHNEVILYRWVEEYEPELFRRIQRLVREGRWHIMGGWFLQPDCNMPSGESFARQAIEGRRYFENKFGVRPSTAINFDPFGHAWGLPQILRKTGYDSYVFCRPSPGECPLPGETFEWVGPDGSSVTATRAFGSYLSHRGGAREKVEKYLSARAEESVGYVLWGIGNHGGGPSRVDLEMLGKLMAENPDMDIRHSTPEAYFAGVRSQGAALPRHAKDMNPWAPGCYTSMARVKRKHREIENTYYMTEKMLAGAWVQGLLEYPETELEAARRDLLTGEFHDILPGSSIQPVEEAAVRMFDHGLEILSRLRARAFFAFASGQPCAGEGEVPILVFNPHPYDIEALVECEFNLADQNRTGTFTQVTALAGRRALPTQVERELSYVPLDWRKRVVFRAPLKAGVMNRFDCRLETVPVRPAVEARVRNGVVTVRTDDLEVTINARTGAVDRFRAAGRDCVKKGAFLPVVIEDHEDPWAERQTAFGPRVAAFKPMSRERVREFARTGKASPAAVRVVEDGPVRCVVEALLEHHDSQIVMRYKIPKQGVEMEVEARVYWNEKNRMLKLEVPTADAAARYIGQVAYATMALPDDGNEAVAQKWTAVVSDRADTALTVINDGTYGSDFRRGLLRLTLLRGPAYAALCHKWKELPDDRYTPRMDQGERLFRFWVSGGSRSGRLAAVDREALAKNEGPMALSFFPSGAGRPVAPLAKLSDRSVLMTAMKKSDRGSDLVVRLFEPLGRARKTTLRLPALGVETPISMGAFEIKTLRVNPDTGKCVETNLLEEA